jgi:hypothetical protein
MSDRPVAADRLPDPEAHVRNLSSTAWLVERGQPERHVPPVWRIAGPKADYRDGEQWTEDAFEATRYATREEAQAVVDALFTGPSAVAEAALDAALAEVRMANAKSALRIAEAKLIDAKEAAE